LLDEKPFEGAAGAKLVGRGDVAGKTCEMVVVEKIGVEEEEPGSKAGGGVKVYIDEEGLVRRVERFRGPWDAPLATRVLELKDLKINGSAAGATYTLEVPDGYRVKASKGNRLGGGGKAGPAIPGVPPSDRSLLAAGSRAPDFSLEDPHEGKKKSLKDYAGKVLVVDFWAVWCGPCKMIMPGLQNVHEKFKDKPVAVVGFSSDQKGSDAVAYKKKQGYTYGLLVEVDEATSRKYRVQGIPTIYVISPKGEIVWGRVGGGDPKELERVLTAIIEDQLKNMDGEKAQEPEKKKEAAKPAEPARKKKGAFDDDE
jgi:thiol-disulfide isomerase/thioredoxin